jgi:hypothetical protein
VNKVIQDVTIGQQNQLSPAPQFVILIGEQGAIVPLDQLQEAIEEFLAQ